MSNPKNPILSKALMQFFTKLNKSKIEKDRGTFDLDDLTFDPNNEIHQELVNDFKEKMGNNRWLSMDRDIYLSIHHHYDRMYVTK